MISPSDALNGRKTWIEGKKARFKQLSDFDWTDFQQEFDLDDSSYFSRAGMLKIKLKPRYWKGTALKVAIHYEGVIYDTVSAAAFSRINVADQTIGLIGEEGIYLSPEGNYYPNLPRQMAKFSVTTRLPEGWNSITDGDRVFHREEEGLVVTRWETHHATDGLYLSAGRYYVVEEPHGDIDLYGYFFPEDSLLAHRYVGAVHGYIDLYEELIGPYPYSKFAVVENFFPTGYGMPSWTLLGKAVVNLPWIINISLGHEVCHNWWGNSVFVDYEKGNWCEGVTVYCADYLYKELQSLDAAREYRRNMLKDYAAYVNAENDFPLTDFRERRETYTRAIGYNKSAMVFHMLRKFMGDEEFWETLGDFYRRQIWKKTSWEDIQRVFDDHCSENMDWFFDQWVSGIGAPALTLNDVSLDKLEDQYLISVELTQETEPFILKVPIKIYFPDTLETRWFEITPGRHNISIGVESKPVAVALDPDFDVFRILDRDETPPSLSEVIGAEKMMIVLPSRGDSATIEAYSSLAERMNRTGEAAVKQDSQVSDGDLEEYSIFIMGNLWENYLFEKFSEMGLKWEKWADFNRSDGGFSVMGNDFRGENVSLMIALRCPANKQNSIAVFTASSPEEIARTGNKLMHYGKYSYLAFDSGRNQLKGKWPVIDNPMRYKFTN